MGLGFERLDRTRFGDGKLVCGVVEGEVEEGGRGLHLVRCRVEG